MKNDRPRSANKIVEAAGQKRYSVWSDERIETLGQQLVDWMEANPDNIFLIDFWSQQKEVVFYKELPDYLASKSDRFAELYAQAKNIQTARLMNKGLQTKVNSNFIEFLLMNLSDYKSRSSFTVQNTSNKISLPAVNLLPEPIKGIPLPEIPHKSLPIKGQDDKNPNDDKPLEDTLQAGVPL